MQHLDGRTERTWPEGAALQPGVGPLLVLEGRAQVIVGGEHIATVGPGEIIAGAVVGSSRECLVVAPTRLRAIDLDPASLVELLHHPTVAAAILRVLTDRRVPIEST
jgi:hypothetical protein